ncbi:hypothetical protein CW705_04695 [Candidatus Bathyarchaeota archaeon]|nr:MAG: hypothetical protein CW705_04695 [Candidatus Bathyarchaeota archaeon]
MAIPHKSYAMEQHIDILTAGFIVVDIIAAGLSKIPVPGKLIFAPLGIRLRIGTIPQTYR